MNNNYVFTLAWNLTSEVEKATNLLYTLNSRQDFKHIIVDLGFPLIHGDKIPDDIDIAKKTNSKILKSICKIYGSDYLNIINKGVSQNWTSVYKAINMDNSDMIAGADPDEHPVNKNWVRAMGNVLRSKENIGLVSLMMTAHETIIKGIPYIKKNINGENVYWIKEGLINWALIGLSGKFFNKIGKIPYPKDAEIYGYIETELLTLLNDNQYIWVILPDYKVRHTDYELGDKGTSKLLRMWKNQIIHKRNEFGQMPFEEYLRMLKTGKIKI